jgi:ketosteroid isomerase-like protein
MKTAIGVLALSLACAPRSYAQGDARSVCAASEKHYAAIRSADIAAVAQQHASDFTLFGNDGGLLWAFQSAEQQRAEFEATPDYASRTFIRHCNAQVYGNVGVSTFYLVGSLTANGNTTKGTWRVTEVWVKQGNDWKEVHHHESPLVPGARP